MVRTKTRLSIVYSILTLLSLIGVGIVVRRTVTLLPVLVDGHQPPATPSATNSPFGPADSIFEQYPLLTLVHILPGLLFVILGPFQFSRTIRKRHLLWHRQSGRVFLVNGVLIGLTALVMSLFMPSIGGFNQAAATTLFSLFFLVALYKAFWHVRHHNVALHREWMIRAYAIGLAVATIRLVIVLLFATRFFTGLTLKDFFSTGFWIGFVLHLIGAEVWINQTRAEK